MYKCVHWSQNPGIYFHQELFISRISLRIQPYRYNIQIQWPRIRFFKYITFCLTAYTVPQGDSRFTMYFKPR